MKFTQHVPDDVEVNLTPLIDVVFLLLIFFMLTTTFDRNAKIEIDLPKTQSAGTVTEKTIMELLVDDRGNYYIDGRAVLNNEPETLLQAMSEVLDSSDVKQPSLVISADAKAHYQAVITAMDIAGQLGITNLSMATTQSQPK